jgi:flagellin-like hook-associated protein FlgL
MRELAIQSSNGINSNDYDTVLQAEMDQMAIEFDRTANVITESK